MYLAAPQSTTDVDATPMLYTLGQLVKNQVCQAWGPPQSDFEFKPMMPRGTGPNYILTLCLIVTDKFKSTAMVTLNITSSPPDPADLSSVAVDGLMEDAVDAQLASGNVGAALGAVISITDTVQGSNETSGEMLVNSNHGKPGPFIRFIRDARHAGNV